MYPIDGISDIVGYFQIVVLGTIIDIVLEITLEHLRLF